jgi:hypothetical protein
VDEIGKYVLPELDVIAKAPIPFVLFFCVIAVAVWMIIGWRYAAVIDALEARIKLQADQLADYKAKLNDASPDEAKARLDALEEMVARLSPPSLTEKQSHQLTSILSKDPGRAYVTLAAFARHSWSLHAALEKCFREAKYDVRTWSSMFRKVAPPNVIYLMVPNINHLTPRQQRVKEALCSVDLNVVIEHQPDHPANEHPTDIWLVVS